MKILLYYPSNKRTISIETLVTELLKRGFEVILLTTCEKGELHTQFTKMGVPVFTHVVGKSNAVLYYIKQIAFLVQFCRKQQIDIIFSHLQPVNIIAVLAQYFVKAKLFVFRHHDFAMNRKEAVTDYIINKLSAKIIVPSSGVKNLMLANESVDPQKLSIIPYIYEFKEYKTPQQVRVQSIRSKYDCELLLIMVSRLVPQKRHMIVFEALNCLVKEGYNIKMLVLDNGCEEEKLRTYIQANRLENTIFMLGYQSDVIDYIEAADVLVHPSISEASCSAVKEAGLRKKIVIACHAVGDFDDYIIHGENGFLMDVNESDTQVYHLLKQVYAQKQQLCPVGEQLRNTVLQKFSASEETIRLYNELLA